MPGSSRDRSVFSLAWRILLPVISITAFIHSLFYRSDVLFFAGEGRCSHWVIDHGVFFTVISDESFGARRAWTALGSMSRHEEEVEMPIWVAPDRGGLWEIAKGLPDPGAALRGNTFVNLKLLAVASNPKRPAARSSKVRAHLVLVTLWPVVLGSLLPLALFLWRTRRSVRWVAEGHCRACGYDLRASRSGVPSAGRRQRDPSPKPSDRAGISGGVKMRSALPNSGGRN